MGLASAFRRVWSQPSRNPPRRPRPGRRPHQLDQEQLVISSYRHHLYSLAQTINTKWAAFDAEPDDFTIVHQLRNLRQQLTTALESYHAALGAADSNGVPYVLNTMEQTDQRLVLLDHQVLAEVQRFEYASLDIASRHEAAIHPIARTTAAADANDVLIELELYRDTWLTIMDTASRNRLDHAQAILREIIQTQPKQHTTCKTLDFHTAAPQTFQSDSIAPGTWPSKPPDRPRQRRTRPPQRSAKPYSPPPPPIGASDRTTSPDREYGSSESGDDGPMRMVISRSRTLRDVAEDVMSTIEQDLIKRSPETSIDQPNLAIAKNMSFASTLYRTRHARVDAISDAGIMLHRSNVRGDGRCMFRALARGRIVQGGNTIPSEKIEKDAADELRARAVAELRKHRNLLAKFYVIEGNFDQYTRKMSYSRTYGGEPELLMLAKLLHVPIAVYILKDGVYRQIQVYGKQYRGDPLRILYSDGVHYDVLLAGKHR